MRRSAPLPPPTSAGRALPSAPPSLRSRRLSSRDLKLHGRPQQSPTRGRAGRAAASGDERGGRPSAWASRTELRTTCARRSASFEVSEKLILVRPRGSRAAFRSTCATPPPPAPPTPPAAADSDMANAADAMASAPFHRGDEVAAYPHHLALNLLLLDQPHLRLEKSRCACMTRPSFGMTAARKLRCEFAVRRTDLLQSCARRGNALQSIPRPRGACTPRFPRPRRPRPTRDSRRSRLTTRWAAASSARRHRQRASRRARAQLRLGEAKVVSSSARMASMWRGLVERGMTAAAAMQRPAQHAAAPPVTRVRRGRARRPPGV